MKKTVFVQDPVTQYACLNMETKCGANDSMLSTALKLRSQRTNDESQCEQNMKHRATQRVNGFLVCNIHHITEHKHMPK